MLAGSQLIQAKVIEDYVYKRRVVMVGDGDCMSLVLGLLAQRTSMKPPEQILVLDFDRRILKFIHDFAREFNFREDFIQTDSYNVRYPVPDKYREGFGVFYTNPPYGSADKGECGKVFLARCMECCQRRSWGVAILPIEHDTDWTRIAMANLQRFLVDQGYIVSEMIRGMHQYSLDDRPELYSGTVVVDRQDYVKSPYLTRTFKDDELLNFYGHKSRRMPSHIEEDGTPVFDGAPKSSGRRPRKGKRGWR